MKNVTETLMAQHRNSLDQLISNPNLENGTAVTTISYGGGESTIKTETLQTLKTSFGDEDYYY